MCHWCWKVHYGGTSCGGELHIEELVRGKSFNLALTAEQLAPPVDLLSSKLPLIASQTYHLSAKPLSAL